MSWDCREKKSIWCSAETSQGNLGFDGVESPFRHRNEIARRQTLIDRPRADQAIVVVLLDHMRAPSARAAAREDRRVQIGWDLKHVEHRRGKQVGVAVQLLLAL